MTAASKMAETEADNECPACGHPVFQAEAFLAANRKWHKRCYKCIGCNTLLSSATCNVFQGNLVCRHCLIEVTRPCSPKLYSDTAKITPQNEGEKGCPRCGGSVFSAEAVVESGLTYHKRCFTCIICQRPQVDKLQVHVGFDKQIYCKTCYPEIWHTPLDGESRSKIKAEPGSGCPRCGGKVFEAERMACKTGQFHKLCFTCKICNRLMNYSNFVDYKDDVFCKSCYFHHFDVRMYHQFDTSAIKGSEGGFETCPRCSGVVYEAEKVVSKHNLYHKSCLTCFQCNHKLDASTFFDANDGHIYCRGCYANLFGTKGRRAKSVGPVDTQKIPASAGEASCCPKCNGKVFEAEKMTAKRGWYHRSCFKCDHCNKLLDATNYFDSLSGGIFCKTCHKAMLEEMTTKNSEYAKSVVKTSIITSSAASNVASCPRCHGVVFDAEKMVMRSGAYHKKCFTCTSCKRFLDYLLAVDGPQAKNVYCHSCYVKNFGPSEQKFNVVSDTQLIKAEHKDNACPRCGGVVFHAEEVWAKERAFHKNCATCFSCNKRLDSLLLNCGPDGEIYCNSCHETHFGSHKGHPYTYHDVKSIKAMGSDAEKCVRCLGKVFDMEKVLVGRSKLVFHKTCLNCTECNRNLNLSSSHATKTYAFEPPTTAQNLIAQGAIFCQRCHLEKFQDINARPCIWSDSSAIKDDKGCPRCGGAVFQAEEVIEKGRTFHKKCFTCFTCKKPLNDKLQVCIGFDQELYCKSCCPSITHTPLPTDPKDRQKVKCSLNDADACPRCSGKVFELEKVLSSNGKVFHKACFSCKDCNKILSVSNAQEFAQDIYCKSCFRSRNYYGKNLYLDRASVQTVKAVDENDPDACVRCKAKAFEPERVLARSGPFHKSCLLCFDCSRLLDASTFNDGRDGGVYCKQCYANKYGHRANRSQSRGPTVFPAGKEDIQCPECLGKIFEAEKFVTQFGPYHIACYKCLQCFKSLVNSTQVFKVNSGKVACKQCYEGFKEEKSFEGMAKALIETDIIKAKRNACPRCQGEVFEAERRTMKVGTYHIKCFSCHLCKRNLDLSNACEGANEVYCSTCYLKNFGPVGANYITPIETDRIKPGSPNQGCPRCGGAVFDMEKVIVKDEVFHKNCASCKTCRRLLDTKSICSVKLQNQSIEIFCEGCYSRLTGTAGFRGSQSAMWVDQQSAVRSSWADPKALKATDPKSGCRKCQGAVFDLDQIHFTKCGIYHRGCFKCDGCSKRLEAATCVETSSSDLFCQKCFKEKFGEDQAPAILASTAQIIATDGKGCPRCGGVVFQAEEIVESGRVYHKQCFYCKACKKPLADRLQAFIGFDKDLYCNTCCPKLKHSIDSVATSKIKGEKQDETCPKCLGKVFDAEKIQTRQHCFHKLCFKCYSCNVALDLASMCEGSNGSVFCKNCYISHYFTGGKNSYLAYGKNSTSSLTTLEIFGRKDPSSCLKCANKVYEAEKVQVRAGLYHQYCLQCASCQKNLEPTNFLQAKDKQIYCAGCYSMLYGVRSRAKSCGPVDYKSIKPTDVNQACKACNGRVFEAEEKLASSLGLYHRACFRCEQCSCPLESSVDSAKNHQGKLCCRQCHDRLAQDQRPQSSLGMFRPLPANDGDPDQCPKCKSKVYSAEMIVAKSGHYHKLCFTCIECTRLLDASNACDGPNNHPYCSSCYRKSFGPQARCSSEDKSVKTDLIKSVSGEGCPRCGGVVYEAEKVMASEVRAYHKKCCSCKTCNQKLDSGTLCNGSDQDIYCQACHSRKFGGASFRGSLAAIWVNEEATSKMRPTQSIDPTKLKLPNDPDSCKKCQGKVFEMEKVVLKSGIWHRLCFACSDCNYSLVSTLDDAFERNGSIYCKPCLQKIEGSHGRPMTYYDPKKIQAKAEDESCEVCQGVVFEAEKVLFNRKLFHMSCFKCHSCQMKLDTLRAESFGGFVYCQTCHNLNIKTRPSTPKSMIAIDKSDPAACPRCGCKVFEAEKMMSKSRIFHKHCFSCCKCNHSLDYTNSMEGPDNEIYCKTCYVKEYFTGGRNKFGDAKSGPPANEKDPDTCPKCHRKAYDMDKVQLSTHCYHKQCLSCSKCQRQLDCTNYYDSTAKDGNIYCQHCYDAKYGVKGQPISLADGNKQLRLKESPACQCPRCGGNVFEAEKVITSVGGYHPTCFKCSTCSRALDQASAYVGGDEFGKDIFCQKCYQNSEEVHSRRSRSRLDSIGEEDRSIEIIGISFGKDDTFAQALIETTAIMAGEGDSNRCPRCCGKVFNAERMASTKNVYHKICFTCLDCHRPLDASSVNEGPQDGLIFCTNCYQKRYGPSVQCSNFAEGKPHVEDSVKVVDPSLKSCHSCHKVVYFNEEIVTNDRSYHKQCAKCFSCKRRLELHSLFDGPNKEIYCSGCYARAFGSIGSGGISTNVWTAEDATKESKSAYFATKPEVVANFDESNGMQETTRTVESETCNRCCKKVYEAEKMVTHVGLYHKSCYNCRNCHTSLSPWTACELGSCKEIYCKQCYRETLGMAGYGYGTVLMSSGQEIKQEYHYAQFF